jgi:quinol-cytochrome oxidoreductase complex cytochrome b subunit
MFKQVYNWIDERVEMHEYIKKDILDKPIPKGLNFSYCFGGITFFLFLMLAVTGYFMTFYYVPTPTQAYDAVDFMTYEVSMGSVVRGVHHWSANLLQKTSRNQLDDGCIALVYGHGLWFYRISFALGSESILGHKGWH